MSQISNIPNIQQPGENPTFEGETDTGIRPIYLKTGHNIACVETREMTFSSGSIMPIYLWRLRENTSDLFPFETNSTEGAEIWEKIKEYLAEHEPPECVRYIETQLSPSDGDTPPWNRTTPARKLDENPDIARMSLNDDGNATRFEKEAAGYLVYDPKRVAWYAWLENHWESAQEKIGRALRFVGRSVHDEAMIWERKAVADPGDSGLKSLSREFAEFATFSKNQTRQNAMRRMVESSAMNVDFDKEEDITLLSFRNGAIDCKTGKIYQIWECESLKTRYPTVYIDTWYTPGARPPRFLKHLGAVFTDNTSADLSEDQILDQKVAIGCFFIRILGYLLYPENREQLFIFLWGSGSNGKSTTIDILREVFGEQIAEPSIKELYVSGDDRPTSGIYRGLSKRIMLFSEASDDENDRKGGRISRDTVKELTGDGYTSRFRNIYAPSERQRIVAKPIGVTNELPRFDKDPDEALLRRSITIPFCHKFEESEKNKDIKGELLQEKDLIFSLCIDELRKYITEGLPPIPPICTRTQEELMAGYEMTQFISSQLVKTEGKTEEDRMTHGEIQDCYIDWCDSAGIGVGTKMALAAGLDQYGCQLKKRALMKEETLKLYKALRINGIKDKPIRGIRHFCCRRV